MPDYKTLTANTLALGTVLQGLSGKILKDSSQWLGFKKVSCFRHEGLRGLYKGLTPYMVHVMPNICLVFLIYEYIVNR